MVENISKTQLKVVFHLFCAIPLTALVTWFSWTVDMINRKREIKTPWCCTWTNEIEIAWVKPPGGVRYRYNKNAPKTKF